MHVEMEETSIDSELIEEALPRYHDLLGEISDSVSNLTNLFKNLEQKFDKNHTNGLPLLNVKVKFSLSNIINNNR